ncbi:MAG TPA: D-alanyl-D-alanine carboxypeptidase family protein [Burkholderiales bacterium]|nr:D-alanyl-D-alanine carboxypeptidase family protein [Burkholderiales bacterium]
MQRLLLPVLLLAAGGATAQIPVPPPSVAASSWLLLDLQSEQVLAERAAGERVEPGALTLLMSAYVVFDALEQKRLSLTEALQVSDKAVRTPGARMYLKPDTRVNADELLRGMIVVPANDAAVALAEGVAGSEQHFVERMNAQARRLGLTDTVFANATGLPLSHHTSTPANLARLAAALVRDYPQHLPLYQLRSFTYNGVTQPNLNWLLGRDPRVDGLATGFTEDGGFSLVATARHGDRRLLAIVTGASSENLRAMEAQKLLNYGFQHYQTVLLYARGAEVAQLPVWKGSTKTLSAGLDRDLFVSVPRGQANLLKARLVSQQPLLAPVSARQPVGELELTFDGRPLGEYPVVALQGVSVANVLVRLWDSLRLLFD